MNAADLLQHGAAFRQGVVSSLLDPTITLIFLTLIPQFVAAGEPVWTTAVLAAALLAVSWCGGAPSP